MPKTCHNTDLRCFSISGPFPASGKSRNDQNLAEPAEEAAPQMASKMASFLKETKKEESFRAVLEKIPFTALQQEVQYKDRDDTAFAGSWAQE
jgi:hypothetical protein